MTAVLVTSTDTPETIKTVLGDKGNVRVHDDVGVDITHEPDAKKDDKAADTSSAAPTDKEGKTSDDSATSGKDQADSDKEGKSDKAVQKRIDQLTREKAELQRQLDAAKAPKEPQKDEPKKEPAKTEKDAEPSPEDFDTQADYMKALSKWAAKQARNEEKAERAKEAETARQNEVVDNWKKQVEAAKAKYKDWYDVMGDVEIGNAVARALVETPDGAEIAYYIGKHPEEAEALKNLTKEREVGMAIGELRAKMRPAQKSSGDKGKEPEEPQTKEKPAPITPVSGTSTGNVSKAPKDMSYKEYKAYRNKQLAEKRKQA